MVHAESTHTVLVAGVPVQTTVTARPAVARRWVRSTWWRLRSGSGTTVGLGVQWTAPSRASVEPPPGTLQLCAENRCLVFQLAQAGAAVPSTLRRFLADTRVTFAGYNVASDCRKLRAHHELDVASTMELRGASDGMSNASMEEMAARHLGLRGVEKSEKVGMSNWDRPTLSKKQVRYACVDAYLSWRLGVHFRGDDASSQGSDDSQESDDGDSGSGESDDGGGSSGQSESNDGGSSSGYGDSDSDDGYYSDY